MGLTKAKQFLKKVEHERGRIVLRVLFLGIYRDVTRTMQKYFWTEVSTHSSLHQMIFS